MEVKEPTQGNAEPSGRGPCASGMLCPRPLRSGVFVSTTWACTGHRNKNNSTLHWEGGGNLYKEGLVQRKPVPYLWPFKGCPVPRVFPRAEIWTLSSRRLRSPTTALNVHVRKKLVPLLLQPPFSSSLLPGAMLNPQQHTCFCVDSCVSTTSCTGQQGIPGQGKTTMYSTSPPNDASTKLAGSIYLSMLSTHWWWLFIFGNLTPAGLLQPAPGKCVVS